MGIKKIIKSIFVLVGNIRNPKIVCEKCFMEFLLEENRKFKASNGFLEYSNNCEVTVTCPYCKKMQSDY